MAGSGEIEGPRKEAKSKLLGSMIEKQVRVDDIKNEDIRRYDISPTSEKLKGLEYYQRKKYQ